MVPLVTIVLSQSIAILILKSLVAYCKLGRVPIILIW